MMNKLTSRLCIFLAVMLLLVSAGAMGLCQQNSKPIPHQPLAMARYRVIKQLQRQIGFFPFYGTLENTPDILFPVGKSDKVYLVLIGTYQKARGCDGDQMLCYELKGKDLRFRYSVRIQEVKKPPKSNTPVRSVNDFLSRLGDKSVPYSYRVSGPASKDAKRDMNLRQNLVLYTMRLMFGVLYVQSLDLARPDSVYDPKRAQQFDVDGDQGSKEQKQWYETYGLPLCDWELAAMKKK